MQELTEEQVEEILENTKDRFFEMKILDQEGDSGFKEASDFERLEWALEEAITNFNN